MSSNVQHINILYKDDMAKIIASSRILHNANTKLDCFCSIGVFCVKFIPVALIKYSTKNQPTKVLFFLTFSRTSCRGGIFICWITLQELRFFQVGDRKKEKKKQNKNKKKTFIELTLFIVTSRVPCYAWITKI